MSTHTHGLTADEKTAARAIQTAMYPKLDADAFRAANHASRKQHGDDRHEVIKWHALHAGTEQLR